MSTIVLRNTKGSELTYVELDANFTNLNTDKLEKATDDTTTNSSFYPVFVSAASSNAPKITTTKLSFNPSTGVLSSTKFSGTSFVGPVVAVGATTLDLSTGSYFTKTISGTTTFTFSNPTTTGSVSSFTFQLTNGGSSSVTWPTGTKWAGGVTPILTTSGVDILSFYTTDAGTTWYGLMVAKDIK